MTCFSSRRRSSTSSEAVAVDVAGRARCAGQIAGPVALDEKPSAESASVATSIVREASRLAENDIGAAGLLPPPSRRARR